MMQAKPITGKVAKMTNAMVHLSEIEIAAPHANIANKLNMLPIFSPVAF